MNERNVISMKRVDNIMRHVISRIQFLALVKMWCERWFSRFFLQICVMNGNRKIFSANLKAPVNKGKKCRKRYSLNLSIPADD